MRFPTVKTVALEYPIISQWGVPELNQMALNEVLLCVMYALDNLLAPNDSLGGWGGGGGTYVKGVDSVSHR